jgi:hypothetical protein
MIYYQLYVHWLKDKSSMPANVARQLQEAGLTDADYKAILALDPFAEGSTVIDPVRFQPTTQSFNYEPPLQESDCVGDVCSCLSWQKAAKNTFATAVENKSSTQYSTKFSESLGGLNVGIFSFGASAEEDFKWTHSSTTKATTDSGQSAMLTVSCPSKGYSGPTNIAVYWDTLWSSFVFVPFEYTRGLAIIHAGQLVDSGGKPVRHKEVQLSYGGKIYTTFSDNNGKYAIYGRPISETLPASAQLTVGTKAIAVPMGVAPVGRIVVP